MGYSEVIEFVQENNIEFIKLMFCDITGVTKNIIISAKEVKKLLNMGFHSMVQVLRGLQILKNQIWS